MQVYPNRFNTKVLAPYYLLFGNEFWFIDKIKKNICESAFKQDFLEVLTLTQDSKFLWNDLLQEWQTLSLFTKKRIIILELPEAKPGIDGSKILLELLNQKDPNIILILIGPKLKQEQTKSKWFSGFNNEGVYVPCNTPEGNNFNIWLKNEIMTYDLKIKDDAFELLSHLYEGNLLACEQALKLMHLIAQDIVITTKDLENWFDDQSRFSVFQLADKLLNGEVESSLHILHQLQSSGFAIQIIFWMIFKEIDILIKLKQASILNNDLKTVFSALRIWQQQQFTYNLCIQKFTIDQLKHMASFCSSLEINLKFKGIEDWIGLKHLIILFDPKSHHFLKNIKIS